MGGQYGSRIAIKGKFDFMHGDNVTLYENDNGNFKF